MQRATVSENLINELLAINTQQKTPLVTAKYKISQYIHFKLNQLPCVLEGPSAQGKYKRIYSKETQCDIIELFAQNHQNILREEKAGRLNNLPNVADIFYSYYQEAFSKAGINEYLRRSVEDKKRETKVEKINSFTYLIIDPRGLDNVDVLNSSDGLNDTDNVEVEHLDVLFKWNFYFYYFYNYVSNNFCSDPDWAEILTSLYDYLHSFIALYIKITSKAPTFYDICNNLTTLDSFAELIKNALVQKLESLIENHQEFLMYHEKIHNTEMKAQVLKEIREKMTPDELKKFQFDKLQLRLEVRSLLLKQHPINDQQVNAWLNPEICRLFKYRRSISTVDNIIGIIAAYLTYIEESDAVKLLNLMKNIFKKERDLIKHRHDTSTSQHSFDKRFGIIPHPILSGYSLFNRKNDNTRSQSDFDKRFGLLTCLSKKLKPDPDLIFMLNLYMFTSCIGLLNTTTSLEHEPQSLRFEMR